MPFERVVISIVVNYNKYFDLVRSASTGQTAICGSCDRARKETLTIGTIELERFRDFTAG
jgi:hypothetical protein